MFDVHTHPCEALRWCRKCAIMAACRNMFPVCLQLTIKWLRYFMGWYWSQLVHVKLPQHVCVDQTKDLNKSNIEQTYTSLRIDAGYEKLCSRTKHAGICVKHSAGNEDVQRTVRCLPRPVRNLMQPPEQQA